MITAGDDLRDRAEARVEKRDDFRPHAVVYLLVNVLLWSVWFGAGANTSSIWPGFSAVGWGVGLGTHWWVAYTGGRTALVGKLRSSFAAHAPLTAQNHFGVSRQLRGLDAPNERCKRPVIDRDGDTASSASPGARWLRRLPTTSCAAVAWRLGGPVHPPGELRPVQLVARQRSDRHAGGALVRHDRHPRYGR